MRLQISAPDIDPLIEGLTIMGTGGGGAPAFGKAILENDLSQGRSISVVSPEDIDDAAQVVSGGIMGSTELLDHVGFDEIVRGWERDFELASATRVMERVLGRRIDAIVPFEVGALNTPVILSVAARLGIEAVDGDALGRSAPQTQMTSFIGHGISLTPMPLVDKDGNVIVVEHVAAPTLPDKLGRYLLGTGSGMGANNHYPMSGSDLKRAVIPSTVSAALQLGRVLIAARGDGRDCVAAVAEHLKGGCVFRGVVSEVMNSTGGGFYTTTVRLQGDAGSNVHDAKLTIQNEAMLLELDGQIATIFPDLICMLDPSSGRGLLSTELRPETPVALITVACHPRLREAAMSPAGQANLGPSTFGFPELRYKPVEDLLAPLNFWRSPA